MIRKTVISLIIISLLMIISLPLSSTAEGGLLPSLTETVGIAMPSLGEALGRYPDEEVENGDGSVAELYSNVSESDFNVFSVYLEQQKAKLADYKAEKGVLSAEIRAKGASFSLLYDSKASEARVTYPTGTFSEWTKNAKKHFEAAQKLYTEDKFDEVYAELFVIPQLMAYEPVVSMMKKDNNFADIAITAAHEAMIEPYKNVGSIVIFGNYPQTKEGTDHSPIEWIVLDYDESNHRSLVISKYGLVNKAFHGHDQWSSWKKSTLRFWLNEDFLITAFSAEEQSAILVTEVDNGVDEDDDIGSRDVGEGTQDRIFLLSSAEAHRYFDVTRDNKNNTKARIRQTSYAGAKHWFSGKGKTEDGYLAQPWWLRSPMRYFVSMVDDNGSLNGGNADTIKSVRPALWLNLDSDFFITIGKE